MQFDIRRLAAMRAQYECDMVNRALGRTVNAKKSAALNKIGLLQEQIAAGEMSPAAINAALESIKREIN